MNTSRLDVSTKNGIDSAISLRVDEDVLAWFKAAGPRYQSRMNAVLRSYMTHMSRHPKRRGAA